ncbi:MAG TPA: 3-hydroxyacyl-CoA dehydrogenase [Actinomycetales bacterium]|nr:3-hydroxyacyl-CoA dehydrogenase [Actinomycetales bacterium]
MDINNSVAVVTGGASGLGLATARRLAEAGASVVLLDLPRTDAEEVLASFGGRATYATADVTDEDQVREAFDVAEEVGPVRVLVNCAGIGTPARVLSRANTANDLAAFQRIVTVNLIGSFNVLRLGAERMMKFEPVGEERGVIVNTASVAAFDGQIGQAAYSASKGGIVGMTLPIARDLADRLIRVVTVAPGTFDTPLLGTLPENIRQSLGAQVPHPSRLGRPEEFGDLVAHVVANPMLNGEVIRLDGAIRMAPR